MPHNPDLCCKNLTNHIVMDKGKIELSNLLPQIAGVILKSGDGRNSFFFYRAWQKQISRDEAAQGKSKNVRKRARQLVNRNLSDNKVMILIFLTHLFDICALMEMNKMCA